MRQGLRRPCHLRQKHRPYWSTTTASNHQYHVGHTRRHPISRTPERHSRFPSRMPDRGSRSVFDYQGRKCKRSRRHPYYLSNCPPSNNCIKAKRCTRHGKRLHESQCWPKCWGNGNCEHGLCQPLEYPKPLETWIGTCPPKPPPLHCVEPRQNDLLVDYHPEPQKA